MSEEKKENFSRDADQTRYIYIAGALAMTTVIGLFVLEAIAMFKFRMVDSAGGILTYKAFIFTPEIVHTIMPITISALTGVGGFLFGREVGKQQMRNGRTN